MKDQFWKKGTSFYLDTAGFQHDYNPNDEARSTETMDWHLPNKGLHPKCTVKGSHVGSGGRVAQFFVAIAHRKGVVLREQLEHKINGDLFAKFIKKHLIKTFNSCQNQKEGDFSKLCVQFKILKSQEKLLKQLGK